MAVAFDAQSTSDIHGLNSSSFSDSTKMTVGAGANALLVLLAFGNLSAISGISVTWDGQAMTLVPGTLNNSGAVVGESTAIFALLAPHSGTKTLAASWTGPDDFYAAAVSYSGVDQTSIAVAFPNGTQNANAGATPGTITITSAVGDAAVAVFMNNDAWITVTSGTQVFLDNAAGASGGGAGVRGAGAATVTLSVSDQSFDEWAVSGCSIKAGASTPPPMSRAMWM